MLQKLYPVLTMDEEGGCRMRVRTTRRGTAMVWVGMGALALSGVTVAAGGSAFASKARQVSHVGKAPVLIGLATPLTGSDPSEGKSEEAIAQDAIAYINQHGGIDGRKARLVVRDTGGTSPSGAVSAFESLVSAGAVVVLGEWTSTNFQAACSVAASEHTVLIGHAAETQGLTNGKAYCFRDEYQVNQQTGAMFGLAKALGWNSIAVAADTTTFGAAENQSWSSLASQYGVKIATDVTWSSPASTLTSQVLQLGHSGAKAVFVGSGSGPDVTLLAKTMVQNGVDLPIIGNGGVNAPGVATAAGSAYDALPAVYNLTSYDAADPAEASFMARISKQTGIVQGGGNPTRLYGVFQIAAAALSKDGGKGGRPLINALQSLGKFHILSGGSGSYVDYTPGNHSGLYGPHMLSIYRWNATTHEFVINQKLTILANKAPGVNG